MPGVKRAKPALSAKFNVRSRIISLLSWLLMVIVLVLLQACSAIKLAYNQSDDLGYWYLDSYLDFTGSQSLQIKTDLQQLLAWHRQTQLPAYVDSLQKLRQLMPTDITASQACGVYADVRAKTLVMVRQAEPVATRLAGQLTLPQLTVMEKKFAKTDEEYRGDYLEASPKAIRKKRFDQALKRAEMLYGSLDTAQVAVINQRLDVSSFDAQLFYKEKLRRQQDILQTLRQLASEPVTEQAIRSAVHALVERSITSPDAVYRAYADKFTEDACSTFSILHNSTTPSQRSKAVEVLNGYEQDFKILNAKDIKKD